MMDRDMRPTRFDLSLEYAREFVTEWFDQNPLGQIGIVGMRGGIGERIGEMSGEFPTDPTLSPSNDLSCALARGVRPSAREMTILTLETGGGGVMSFFSFRILGNPQDVLRAISERHRLEPVGEPSLQNAIEMARSSMRSAPPHLTL
jgi:transcription initiation factor TFIIH subunit 2